MTKDQIKELAAGYCLGALSAEDRNAFEKLLQSGDPVARDCYQEMQMAASVIPYSAEPVSPPAHLKENIFAEITAEAAKEHPPIKSVAESVEPASASLANLVTWWRGISLGIAMASCLIIAGMYWYFTNVTAENQQTISGLQTEIASLKIVEAEKERLLNLVQNYENRVLTLARAGQNVQQANVKVILAPDDGKAVFFGSDLQPLPEGKVYLLWKLEGAQPINAGAWQIDENGNLIYEIGDISEAITTFAITIESSDGADSLAAPTSDIELIVEI